MAAAGSVMVRPARGLCLIFSLVCLVCLADSLLDKDELVNKLLPIFPVHYKDKDWCRWYSAWESSLSCLGSVPLSLCDWRKNVNKSAAILTAGCLYSNPNLKVCWCSLCRKRSWRIFKTLSRMQNLLRWVHQSPFCSYMGWTVLSDSYVSWQSSIFCFVKVWEAKLHFTSVYLKLYRMYCRVKRTEKPFIADHNITVLLT